MTKKNSLLLAFTLFAGMVGFAPSAQATELSVTGGGIATSVNAAQDGDYRPAYGVTTKVELSSEVGAGFWISLGAQYLLRRFSNDSVTLSNSFIHLPVMLHFRPFRFLALGAGLSYGVSVARMEASGATGVLYGSPSDFGLNNVDLAAVLGGALRIPVGVATDLLLESRYQRSVISASPGQGFYYRDLTATFGFAWSF